MTAEPCSSSAKSDVPNTVTIDVSSAVRSSGACRITVAPSVPKAAPTSKPAMIATISICPSCAGSA
jgi:hypothetical protein